MAIKQYEFALKVTGLCQVLASEVGHRPPLARTALPVDQNGQTRPHRKVRHSIAKLNASAVNVLVFDELTVGAARYLRT